MKMKIIARASRSVVACLLLFAVICCSSCQFSLFGSRTIPFSEITYERPDFDSLSTEIDNLIVTVKSDASLMTMLSEISLFNAHYTTFYTMLTLSQIAYYTDITDESAAAEMAYFNEKEPLIQQKMNDFYIACAQSPMREDLEKQCFGEGFLDEFEDESTMSDKLVSLLQKEQELVAQYTTYINETKVPDGNGNDLTINEAGAADDIYLFYTVYLDAAYDDLCEIYCQLAEVRAEIAAETGYQNYNEYANHTYNRTHSPEALAAYLQELNSTVKEIYLSYVGDIQTGKKNNPLAITGAYCPIFSTENMVKNAVSNLSSDFSTVYQFMQKYQMYNIAPSEKKYNMSFTTYLYAYDTPYLLLNPTETYQDVIDFSHEFGHFVDMYRNGATNDLDLAETFSQAMSLLAVSRLSDTALSEKMQAAAVFDLIDTMYYQSSLALFEYDVYRTNPEELRENIQNYASLSMGEVSSLGYQSWILIPHLFTQPCYVQSYCFSADAAAQIYAKECQEADAGLECYFNLLTDDRAGTFGDILARAGLVNPLSEGHIADLAASLREWIAGKTAAAPQTDEKAAA